MKRAALVVLCLSVTAIAVTYGSAFVRGTAPAWGAAVVAFATSLALIATMALGASREGQRNGGLGKLAIPFLVTLAILLAAFALALFLPGEGEPIILGLPRRAAVLLYGIGVLPVLILPLAYAATFEEMTLSDEDLERVRQEAREREDQAEAEQAQ